MHHQRPVDASLEQLYNLVQSLCSHKKAESLYRTLTEQCRSHIVGVVGELASRCEQAEEPAAMEVDGEEPPQPASSAAGGVIQPLPAAESLSFLQLVDKAWGEHEAQMLAIRSIFLYLDRSYVVQHGQSATSSSSSSSTSSSSSSSSSFPYLPRSAVGVGNKPLPASFFDSPTTASSALLPVKSLWDMGLRIFCENLLSQKAVRAQLFAGILLLVEKERQGENVQRPLLKRLLRMLSALELYATLFEPEFLSATKHFYRAEADRLLQSMVVSEYLAHVSLRLGQEVDRVTQYLDTSTRRPLVKAVELELIKRHAQFLLTTQSGFGSLMQGAKTADLALMYSLFARVSALPHLNKAFAAYIHDTGKATVMDPEKDKQMVESLLAMKKSVDLVLAQCFCDNPDFVKSMRLAFEQFINLRPNAPAEMLAKFVDRLLRPGGAKRTDEEQDALMDQVLFLFRYVHSKDIFQAFYKKDLAKRLLLNKSASQDSEATMLSKIKGECGPVFTGKLEAMFKDMTLSESLQSDYSEHVARHGAAAAGGEDVEISVRVLTTSSWPKYEPDELVVLPDKIKAKLAHFRDFYLGKHKSRRLTWQTSLSTCLLKAHYPKGAKNLSVSAYQATVLLLFNEAESLTTLQIKQLTGIEDGELRRTLQSLACIPPVLPLLKEPMKTKKIADEDVFRVNQSFKHKLFRIQINSIQLKETAQERKDTSSRVYADRQYMIDAGVVRIMKARKSIPHVELVRELMEQLKTPVTGAEIKARIASLIEREYMARDPDKSSVYNYMA